MRIYNPEGSKIRATQLQMLEALKAFDKICKEHDIKWWMDSGTLLGAARHGGFIPWDDDMDVCMMMKDYRKFCRVMRHINDDKYFFQNMSSEIEHINAFGMFRLKEGDCDSTNPRAVHFKYKGVGIDIFPLEYASRFASHTAKFFYLNLQHPTQYIKNKTLRHIAIRAVEILNFGIIIPIIRFIGWINPKGQFRYRLGSGFYNAYFYPEQIFPLSSLKFEGVEFPAPKDTESYLKNLYGDWRQIPSEDKIKTRIHNQLFLKEMFG
ncbi:MAG: phosphorylcholine transferase LicD [Candidatus Cryptobacteroides sp.]